MDIALHLAKTLLDLSHENGRVTTRQTDLAATLGVSRYTIHKTLKTLAHSGMIARGYGEIKILNIDNLTRWIEDQSPVETLSPLISPKSVPLKPIR